MFLRPISNTLSERLEEPRRFIQALIGPRQTGKTTVARQIISGTKIPSHYASADEPVLRDRVWIEQQWEAARFRLKVVAIEVKSGRKKVSLPGLEAFSKEFPTKRKLLVGAQGIPLEEFLHLPVQEWLR